MQPYVYALGSVAAVGLTFAYRRVAIMAMNSKYSQYEADELAKQWGLRQTNGNPSFNLMMRQDKGGQANGASGTMASDIQIRMVGAVGKIPVEFRYISAQTVATGIVTNRWQSWQDCRFVAATASAFPAFEVVSRTAKRGSVARTSQTPQIPTGRADVDALFGVATAEPNMARLLGEVLPRWAELARLGVHIVGDGTEIAVIMHEAKPPMMMDLLPHGHKILSEVAALARRVGG